MCIISYWSFGSWEEMMGWLGWHAICGEWKPDLASCMLFCTGAFAATAAASCSACACQDILCEEWAMGRLAWHAICGAWKPASCCCCRWGNAKSPAYGTLNDYQFMRRHTNSSKRQEKAKQCWGASLSKVDDVNKVFVKYAQGMPAPSLPVDTSGHFCRMYAICRSVNFFYECTKAAQCQASLSAVKTFLSSAS